MKITIDISDNYQQIAQAIRNSEHQSKPTKISFGYLRNYHIKRSTTAKIVFPLYFSVETANQETYIGLCPFFGLNLKKDTLDLNKISRGKVIYGSTLAELLTHTNTKAREAAKQLLDVPIDYELNFKPNLYYGSTKELEKDLKKLDFLKKAQVYVFYNEINIRLSDITYKIAYDLKQQTKQELLDHCKDIFEKYQVLKNDSRLTWTFQIDLAKKVQLQLFGLNAGNLYFTDSNTLNLTPPDYQTLILAIQEYEQRKALIKAVGNILHQKNLRVELNLQKLINNIPQALKVNAGWSTYSYNNNYTPLKTTLETLTLSSLNDFDLFLKQIYNDHEKSLEKVVESCSIDDVGDRYEDEL